MTETDQDNEKTVPLHYYECPECGTTLDTFELREACRRSMLDEKFRLAKRFFIGGIILCGLTLGLALNSPDPSPPYTVLEGTQLAWGAVIAAGFFASLFLTLLGTAGIAMEVIHRSPRRIPWFKPWRFR